MKRYIIVLLTIFFFLAGTTAFAALPVLAYFENESGGLRLILPNGTALSGDKIEYGMDIPIGTTIITENSDFAEISLSNGSIIKIHENTNFKVLTIQGENNAAKSSFDMQVGKFRTVAGKKTGNEQYEFKTRTAVCGVRGTDTGAESLIDPVTRSFLPSKVFVFDGEVLVTKLDEAGKALGDVVVKTGQWFDSGAAELRAQIMSPAVLEGFKSGLDFKKLLPDKVPGHTTAAADTTPPATTGTGTTPPPETTPPAEDPEWVKAIKDIIGLEIGTVTIGGDTYAKAVLTPVFNFGKLKLALYLPIIYQTNMFDAADWYKPDGNWEWSFGTDESFGDDWIARSGDFLYDLVLKIKGLEYGDNRDDFYIRIGSLNTFTIGHGTIMRNYANDSDFPAIRRIGFNLGVDTGPFGFELISNDLGMAAKYEPEVLGTRIYVKPAYPFELAFGLTVIADLDPAKDIPNVGDPMFFNTGLDVELPIVTSDALDIVLFADASVMIPYFREEVPGAPTIPSGFATDALWHGAPGEESLKNYGITAGALGNILFFEWRLEGRYYTGKYRPAFFNAIYDRVKYDYINEVISYLQDPGTAENNVTTFGVYGEGSFEIQKICTLTMGYLLPLEFSESGIGYADDDYFIIKFELLPNVIPIVGIFGSISYERTKFVTGFSGGLPELFDSNTVVRTTIGYPVAEGLNILLHYTTTQIPNELGILELQHALTIETVIDF
ncbi:MAG: FecR domain-containing protein [Spirochaetales bacterium]|nr:FecR domain-containing protein [Spirochaetales bacterium]